MRWAVIFHPDQIVETPEGHYRLIVPPMVITEAELVAARAQGWIALARESDVCLEPTPKTMRMDLLSNPRRRLEPPPSSGDET